MYAMYLTWLNNMLICMVAILDLYKFDPLNSKSQLGKHHFWIHCQKYYRRCANTCKPLN